MVRRSRAALAAVAFSLAACNPPASGGASGTKAPTTPAVPTPAVTNPAAPTASGEAALFTPTAKAPTTAELADFAASNNAFALGLYAKVRSQQGNLAMSPFSISSALMLALAGARGETADQMRHVLHLPSTGDRPFEIAGSLIASYGDPANAVTLRVANRLFGEKSYAFEAPYLAKVRADFGAPLEPLDFKSNPEESRGRINAWVSHETEGRNKDLIPPGAVGPMTRLVLTNAIYFLGDWAIPFEKSATHDAPFSVTKDQQKPVPTMYGHAGFRFAGASGAKLLEMPYKNGALAMTLVLPDAVDGLDALEAGLTPAVLDQWTKALTSTEVKVALPKFEINPPGPMAIGKLLAGMGMPDAFDAAKADFTAIANPATPADRLSLDSVFHKAFVRVDEKGTEAAAATAVVMRAAGARLEPKVVEFRADHPFLFLLRDTRSGAILFMGRVNDPSSRA